MFNKEKDNMMLNKVYISKISIENYQMLKVKPKKVDKKLLKPLKLS